LLPKMVLWRRRERLCHTDQECAMFDQPPSLPMRAAIASLFGGLFGVALILFTHATQAQAPAQVPESATVDQAGPTADVGSALERLSGTTLRSLRGAEAPLSGGAPGSRGLRINDSGGSEVAQGLRWRVMPGRSQRSDAESLRSNEPISLGVQVRF
jgi:hypothetical protein